MVPPVVETKAKAANPLENISARDEVRVLCHCFRWLLTRIPQEKKDRACPRTRRRLRKSYPAVGTDAPQASRELTPALACSFATRTKGILYICRQHPPSVFCRFFLQLTVVLVFYYNGQVRGTPISLLVSNYRNLHCTAQHSV